MNQRTTHPARALSFAVVCIVGILGIAVATSKLATPTTEAKAPTATVAPTSSVPPATVEVIQTTTTSSTTTTTMPDLSGVDFVALARATYGRCGEWHDLAISVGWTEENWPTLSRVMWRESRCIPTADSGPDHGLTQINQVHKKNLAPYGWTHDDMFNPELNLRFALILWQDQGWEPWRSIATGELP